MFLTAPFRLPLRIARRFHDERCAQTAAALSFATLVALVPMIAVTLALISKFPFAAGLGEALERFLLANLLPEKAGDIIAKYVGQFAHRVDRVTLLGIGALGATALAQMLTIEHAFNSIWGVRKRRPVVHRVAFHVLAMMLGPLLFGGSLILLTYVASASLGLVNEPRWVTLMVSKGLYFVVTSVLFGIVFWALPYTKVVKWHAAAGGLAAAFGFAGLQYLFALYVVRFSGYTVLYGGFYAIPVFLVWIYASWGVVLIGALLVAELPRLGSD